MTTAFAQPTLGTFMHMHELHNECDGKTGMAFVKAKLRELNFKTCWTSKESKDNRWGAINRHLWRISAMYEGGDCFLAEFAGAVPHQRLYPSKTVGQKHSLPGYKDTGNG